MPRTINPEAFSIHELRYFHYFLTRLSHPLPLGNSAAWLKEIPQISHSKPFLLHAMLALGVSELGRANPCLNVGAEVLKHRGKAIYGLQKAVEDVEAWSEYGHADAILSSTYLLVYQSSHMPDALRDFETFAQGCELTTTTITDKKLRTILNVTPEWSQDRVTQSLQFIPDSLSEGDQIFAKSGLDLLDEMEAAARQTGCHDFWFACRSMAALFMQSPSAAWMSSLHAYSRWYLMSPGVIKALKMPQDYTAMILVAVFLANMVFSDVLVPYHLWPDHIGATSKLPVMTLQHTAQWIEAMYQTVPDCAQAKMTRSKIMIELFPQLPPLRDSETQMKSKMDVLEHISERAHMLVGSVLRLGSDLTEWFENLLEVKCKTQKAVSMPG